MNDNSYEVSRRGSDFVGALGEAIRQNPVPAALVGAGFFWLLMGGRHVVLGSGFHALLSGVGEGAKRSSGAAYRGGRYVGGQASEGVSRTAEGAAQLSSRISEGMSRAADAVSNAAGNVAETVTHAASATAERAWSGEPNGSHQTQQASVTKRTRDSLAHLFAKQPLLLGAVGIAIGAGIAASMPGSEAEDRLMGATADAARDRGEALWEEAKKRGTDIASRGLEEARAQSLTPEAAADVARAIGSKVAGIAENASRGVSDRIKG